MPYKSGIVIDVSLDNIFAISNDNNYEIITGK